MILKNSTQSIHEMHPFHMVNNSPWPLFSSFALLKVVLNFILFFHYFQSGSTNLIFSLIIFCFFLFRWFSDIILESTFEGHHTKKVQQGIRFGMFLFILSEVMFFFSFFWGFFHFSLSPSIGMGCVWPPSSILTLDPWGLPLTNTIILLSSGVTITSAHRAILSGGRETAIINLFLTLVLGGLFTSIQGFEYMVAPFSINDGIFGSLFFLLTGFHGLHVFVGSLFLLVCLQRHVNYQFTIRHHVGFEAAAWYWHFVDVVWLGLFLLVYIWGK